MLGEKQKMHNQRLREVLACLLVAACAVLLMLNLLPSLRKQLAADSYRASGRAAAIEPVIPPVGGSVNVNTATLEELDTLKGVGPAIAQAIIDERQANGPYFYPEDLMDAKGIGEKRFADVVDSITVGE